MPWPRLASLFRKEPAFDAIKMIDRVLESEGGVNRDPADRGNAGGFITNRGVTRRSLADFRGCHPEQVTNRDIEELTLGDARAVAYRLYYERPGIDKLPEKIRGAVTDFAFNSGPVNAVQALQQVVGCLADGRIGPVTVRHCAAYGADWVLDKYCNARIAFVERIVERDETQRRFLKGWIARAEKWRKG